LTTGFGGGGGCLTTGFGGGGGCLTTGFGGGGSIFGFGLTISIINSMSNFFNKGACCSMCKKLNNDQWISSEAIIVHFKSNRLNKILLLKKIISLAKKISVKSLKAFHYSDF